MYLKLLLIFFTASFPLFAESTLKNGEIAPEKMEVPIKTNQKIIDKTCITEACKIWKENLKKHKNSPFKTTQMRAPSRKIASIDSVDPLLQIRVVSVRKLAIVKNDGKSYPSPFPPFTVLEELASGAVYPIQEETSDGNWFGLKLEQDKIGWVQKEKVKVTDGEYYLKDLRDRNPYFLLTDEEAPPSFVEGEESRAPASERNEPKFYYFSSPDVKKFAASTGTPKMSEFVRKYASVEETGAKETGTKTLPKITQKKPLEEASSSFLTSTPSKLLRFKFGFSYLNSLTQTIENNTYDIGTMAVEVFWSPLSYLSKNFSIENSFGLVSFLGSDGNVLSKPTYSFAIDYRFSSQFFMDGGFDVGILPLKVSTQFNNFLLFSFDFKVGPYFTPKLADFIDQIYLDLGISFIGNKTGAIPFYWKALVGLALQL